MKKGNLVRVITFSVFETLSGGQGFIQDPRERFAFSPLCSGLSSRILIQALAGFSSMLWPTDNASSTHVACPILAEGYSPKLFFYNSRCRQSCLEGYRRRPEQPLSIQPANFVRHRVFREHVCSSSQSTTKALCRCRPSVSN